MNFAPRKGPSISGITPLKNQWLEDEMSIWGPALPHGVMVSWRGRSVSQKSMKIDPLEITLRGRTKKDRSIKVSFFFEFSFFLWVIWREFVGCFFSEKADSYKKHNGEKPPELHWSFTGFAGAIRCHLMVVFHLLIWWNSWVIEIQVIKWYPLVN